MQGGESAACGAMRHRFPSRGLALTYAAGGLVDGVMFNALNTFLFFYLSTATKIPVDVAAIILAAAVVVDAIAAPLIGSASDNLGGRFGKRLPLMLMALPFAIWSIHGVFALPDAPVHVLVPQLAVLAIVARISLSMFQLPHLALGADMMLPYERRSRLTALRWFCNICGGLIAVLGGLAWEVTGADAGDPAAFERFAVLLPCVVAAGGVSGSIAAWRLKPTSSPGTSGGKNAGLSLLVSFVQAVRNPTFRLLVLGSGVFFAGFSIGNMLNLHAKIRFWQLNRTEVSCVLLAYFAGLLGAAPVAGWIVRWFEKKTVACAGLIGFILVQAGPVILHLFGALPFAQFQIAMMLSITSVMGGLALGLTGATLNSMIGDIADEHRLLYGSNLQGTFYGATAFANKLANGLGIAFTGLALDLLKFSPSDGLDEAETFAVGLLYGPIAGGLSLIALIPLMRYRIDRHEHARIVAALGTPSH